MTDRIALGKKGEDITVDFLKKHGFIIFKRNYHSRMGEIDIIAEKDDLLLFIEVKTRIEDSFTSPAEAVDLIKQNKIKQTAKNFMSKTVLDYRCRYDVSEVTLYKENGNEKYKLNYIKSAFE